jgi:hypothetical protein
MLLLNGHGLLPEAERNLTGSLPLRPVVEYGFDIISAEVIVLLESYLLGQILGLNVIVLGSLQFYPGDSSLSCTRGNL